MQCIFGHDLHKSKLQFICDECVNEGRIDRKEKEEFMIKEKEKLRKIEEYKTSKISKSVKFHPSPYHSNFININLKDNIDPQLRKWRSICRILMFNEDEVWIIFGGYNSEVAKCFSINIFPKELVDKFYNGYRFFANVNIGCEDPKLLEIEGDFEYD